MKVCIVGGVAGGATAAARLRRLNEAAEIVMFERGKDISFANCGLPYHLSGLISDRSELLLQTPESFRARFNVDVRIENEVIAIDRTRHTLTVRRTRTGETYEETYDKLILAPGAKAIVPPIAGAGSHSLLPLKDLPDLDAILEVIRTRKPRSALVIGGGFIGVETAENLHERGIETSIIELGDQIMAPFDREMAQLLHQKLKEKGIGLHLGDAVERLEETPDGQTVFLRSGARLRVDLVVAAIGVRPEVTLATGCGLPLGERGGIVVDEHMRTEDPDIYAVGDAVEVPHLSWQAQALVPLASPANKQARIAADNLCGIPSRYRGALATGIVKLFELQAASTGLNEKMARRLNIPFRAVHLHPNNHAGYYPGASPLAFKLLFSPTDGKVLGAQCIGTEGADKRIDVIATAIRANMTVFDLEELELCYAPPFGSAKDPINQAAHLASNVLKGLASVISCDALPKDHVLVDVRTLGEVRRGTIPGAMVIPVDDLRSRLHEIPRDRPVVVYCAVGVRAHVASRILLQSGWTDVHILSGGYKTFLQRCGT